MTTPVSGGTSTPTADKQSQPTRKWMRRYKRSPAAEFSTSTGVLSIEEVPTLGGGDGEGPTDSTAPSLGGSVLLYVFPVVLVTVGGQVLDRVGVWRPPPAKPLDEPAAGAGQCGTLAMLV